MFLSRLAGEKVSANENFSLSSFWGGTLRAGPVDPVVCIASFLQGDIFAHRIDGVIDYCEVNRAVAAGALQDVPVVKSA